MDLNLLPNELLKMVISYLDKKDAKNLAFVSKRMHELTLEKIWSKPIYQKSKSLCFLRKISHFPIEELRVADFELSDEEIIEVTKTIPTLKRLCIDWEPRSFYLWE